MALAKSPLMPILNSSSPSSRASLERSAKCIVGSSSKGGMHMSPSMVRLNVSRQSAMKPSVSSGARPAFCGSSPVLTCTNRRGRFPCRSISSASARPKLARALGEEIERQGNRPRLFVQVNTGEEPQKAGLAPDETEGFIALCRDTFNLNIDGLMCIPPFDEEPTMHFALLSKLARELGLDELSMGMSGDFAKAIACGATYVRVGTAIFGERVLLD